MEASPFWRVDFFLQQTLRHSALSEPFSLTVEKLQPSSKSPTLKDGWHFFLSASYFNLK